MKDHKSVDLAWQAPETREWHVVGLLRQRGDEYTFNYTKGALSSEKFTTFSGMDDIKKTYVSIDLFPLFKNRMLSPKTPEYPNFISWLGLNESEENPIDILGRSGGLRGTDQLQVFKKIEVQNDGSFQHVFFAHGLSHLSTSAFKRVGSLKRGELLSLCLDCQNSYDITAVIIRANDPAEIVGYCPRYLSKELNDILRNDSSCITICIESLCDSAPANYKLMCNHERKLHTSSRLHLMNQSEYQIL